MSDTLTLAPENKFDILREKIECNPKLKNKINIFVPEYLYDGINKIINTRLEEKSYLTKEKVSDEVKKRIFRFNFIPDNNAKIKHISILDDEEESPVWPRNRREKHELFYALTNFSIVLPNKSKAFLWFIYENGFDSRNGGEVHPVISYDKRDEKYIVEMANLASETNSLLTVDEKTIITIGGDDISLRGRYSWDDVILPENIIKSLKDDLEFWINNEQFYKEKNIPYKRGYLLEGPPGNGKTLCARIIMSCYDFACYSFDFSNPRMGDSELASGFNRASRNAPAIVLMEDIDRIFETRKCLVSKEGIMNCLDGVAVSNGIITIATSNNPEVLDPAIRMRPGRFDVPIRFDNPNCEQKFAYLKKMIKEFNELDEKTIMRIIEETDKKSMAYMKLIIETAGSEAFKEGSKEIRDHHLLNAFENVSRYYKTMETSAERKTGFVARETSEDNHGYEYMTEDEQNIATARPIKERKNRGFHFSPNKEYFG